MMKNKACALAVLMLTSAPCRADQYDVTYPNGLTVTEIAAANYSLAAPLTYGYVMVKFAESLGTPWIGNCGNSPRLYLTFETQGGKAAYHALLLAKALGKKITRIVGNTANPDAWNICTLNVVYVE